MTVCVKICGIKTLEALNAAIKGGAAFVGFNFYPASPRYVTPEQAHELASHVPAGIETVALFADAKDEQFESTLGIFQPDIIQLHGMESPKRVIEIKKTYERPIIKALAIGHADDLEETIAFEGIANWFLFDARPPKGSELPGGNAVSFDWNIMKEYVSPLPWMLAGGVNTENIAEAVKQSGTKYIDISSGVERSKGEKDPALILEILEKAKKLG